MMSPVDKSGQNAVCLILLAFVSTSVNLSNCISIEEEEVRGGVTMCLCPLGATVRLELLTSSSSVGAATSQYGPDGSL